MLNATPDSSDILRCGQVPLYQGRMGRKGDHIAIRIEGAIKREKG
jgi:flagellar motor switch protein FliM